VLLYFWMLRPLGEYDVFYYVALGDWIRDHHQLVPYPSFLNTADRFAALWDPNPEWATGVLTSLLYGIDGPETISRAIAVALTSMFLLAYLAARAAGAPAWAAWLVTALAVPCFESRVMWRSGLMTDLFLSGLLLFYLAARRQGWRRPAGRLGFLFFYGLVWTQFHQGFVSGLILMFLWFFGTLLDARRQERLNVVKQGISEGLAFALGTLVRPTIYGSYLFIIEHMRRSLPMQLVLEWVPLGLSSMKGVFGLYCGLSLLSVAVLLAWGWRRRRRGESLYLISALLLLVYGGLMCRYVRGVGEFVPVSVPCLALALSALAGSWRERFLQSAAPWLMALAAIVLYLNFAGPTWGSVELRHQRFLQDYPVDDLALLKSGQGLGTGRLFNSYHFGGFLAGYGVLPFVHGWTPLYPDNILVDYLDIVRSEERSPKLLDDYGIDKILLAYPRDYDPASVRFLQRLYDRPGWELFAFDDAALLFRRRGSGPGEPALRGLRPGTPEPLGAPGAVTPAELELAYRRAPDSPYVLSLMGDWYRREGDLGKALAVVEEGLARFRFSPIFYQRKTEYLLQRKDARGAVAAAEQGMQVSVGNQDQLAESLARAYITLWKEGDVSDFPGQRRRAVRALERVGRPTRNSSGLLATLRQLQAP
jgi:hypothetical protein